jgi:hypothetical protein
MALQLMILSKHTFKVLYQTSPVEGKVQCMQASLLEGEGMRILSTSSKQTAAPATPSTFITSKSPTTSPEALPAAAQLAWTVCFLKPSCVQAVHNPQPSNGLAHLSSHALHLTSSLQVPGIADDPDEAEGVCTVGYDAPASLKGIEDM